MEIFYKSLFNDVLVPVQCISVSWTPAAHLVFSSYVCCLQNSFETPKSLKVMSKRPMKKGLILM